MKVHVVKAVKVELLETKPPLITQHEVYLKGKDE